MNDFLKSLAQYGMEGMQAEEYTVEAYANSECSEELIELDNLDNAITAMESMSDAIMEEGLSMQTLALEAAGFGLDNVAGFNGELSNEAVGNMIKRGYYEVKIQVKKVIGKIWKLIVSVFDQIIGSEGRFKSYGKLFKKYTERLRNARSTTKKDNEDKEVTIRLWEENGVVRQVEWFIENGAGIGPVSYKDLTAIVRSFKISKLLGGVLSMCSSGAKGMQSLARGVDASFGTRLASLATNAAITGLSEITKAGAEAAEKIVNEFMDAVKDNDSITTVVEAIKEVDSDEMSVDDAKAQLMRIGSRLEDLCKRDVRFKKDLLSLKKAWTKSVGQFDPDKDIKDGSDNVKDAYAAILRALNKCGGLITGLRLGLSKIYKAIASNLQGVLADMAKVISKATSISGN